MTNTPHKTYWANILFFLLCGVLVAIHVYKLSPALPAIRADLGMSFVTGGHLFSIINIIGMIFGVFFGGIASKLGHKHIITGALLLVTVTSLITSFMTNQNMVLLLRLIEGIGVVAVAVSAPSLIAEQASNKDRQLAMSAWGTYMPTGSVLCMLFAPYIIQQVGWQGLWQLSAMMSFCLLLVMFFWVNPKVTGHNSNSNNNTQANLLSQLDTVLRRPIAWIITLEFSLFTFIFVGVIAWFPSYLIEEKSIAPVLAGILAGIFVCMNIIGNLISGTVMHSGIRPLLIVLCSSSVIALCSIGMFNEQLPDLLRYALCLVFSLSAGLWPAAVFGHAMLVIKEPSQRSIMNGLLVNGAFLGIFLGPIAVAATVATFKSWHAASWIILLAAFIAAVVAYSFRNTK